MNRCSVAAAFASLLFLAGPPVLAATETTPWGPFEFPSPVRNQREAQLMYNEAKAPIVVAIRFLALADTTNTPWINQLLACGTGSPVRKDLVLAMIRASTLMAHRLAEDLEQGRIAADELRAGRNVNRSVRYAGPIAVVLEPVRISADGEQIPPPAIIEPHLRVFVSAAVPRCASDATGAYGRLGEFAGGFMITASPALELGWPTYSTTALGQRVVMATENLLAEGFCCGQESAFGLESLVNVYDYRDYQTKSKLRNTLRSLGNAKQRDITWVNKVRDAFGVPDRFPETYVKALRYGSGRIAGGEMVIWPTRPELFGEDETAAITNVRATTLADFLLALAWYAHIRADLISPAILESYDPERKYSFVGWPEEFRAALGSPDAEGESQSAPGGKVLEVFGTERKYSFVGQPDAIQDNIAFAFAAWKAEIEFAQLRVTRPFLERYAPDSEWRQATQIIAQGEADAVNRRRPQTYRPLFDDTAKAADTPAPYSAAVRTLDRKFGLPGYATLDGVERTTQPAGSPHELSWAGSSADISADSVEELRARLVRLYRDTYREQLGEPLPDNP